MNKEAWYKLKAKTTRHLTELNQGLSSQVTLLTASPRLDTVLKLFEPLKIFFPNNSSISTLKCCKSPFFKPHTIKTHQVSAELKLPISFNPCPGGQKDPRVPSEGPAPAWAMNPGQEPTPHSWQENEQDNNWEVPLGAWQPTPRTRLWNRGLGSWGQPPLTHPGTHSRPRSRPRPKVCKLLLIPLSGNNTWKSENKTNSFFFGCVGSSLLRVGFL